MLNNLIFFMNLPLKRVSFQLTADQVDYLREHSSPGISMSHLVRDALQKQINRVAQKQSINFGSVATEELAY